LICILIYLAIKIYSKYCLYQLFDVRQHGLAMEIVLVER